MVCNVVSASPTSVGYSSSSTVGEFNFHILLVKRAVHVFFTEFVPAILIVFIQDIINLYLNS